MSSFLAPVVSCSAPAKLVLFGEYVVLTGAPGVAMALDARARCTFETEPQSRRWTIETLGFESQPVTTYLPAIIMEPAPAPSSPLYLLWYALNSIKGGINDLPAGGTLTLDSRAFQRDGKKFGLGSSAAVCTALTALLQHLADQTPRFETAFRAHKTAQDGKGSGLDVAAAFHGGLVLLENADGVPQPRKLPWNPDLHYRVVWTVQPASTVQFINRFSDWRQAHPEHPSLRALAGAAAKLREGLSCTAFQAYAAALLEFDSASTIGIYTPMHRELHDLAGHQGVVYKPCGAGGGDIGIVIADSAAALASYEAALLEQWAAAPDSARPHLMDLRLTLHGARIES